ncbi:MAG: glutamine-hydrolyzing GMP synthase [Candidatus Hatepunaea meridiana]|nr:glutamine-hydrolyzing GMP synthase [Candidatus Hatepunaea meridiana]
MIKQRETILILDFGSQYTQLIARRCREEGVFSLIEPWDWAVEEIRKLNPVGIILSGGPLSVYDSGSHLRHTDLIKLGIPLLGICYGMHLLVLGTDGEVSSGETREYGRATIMQKGGSRLLDGLERELPVWMSHGDRATHLTEGWKITAESDSGIIAAIERPQANLYGVQFHPEVSHTPSGDKILRNFLYNICSAKGGWDMKSFAMQAIEEIKDQIGNADAICGLSGGVDSSVAATMVFEAIGNRLRCVLVDNGLMRKNEAAKVEAVFRPRFGDNLIVVDAGNDFLTDLAGVSDPEKKRKLIGNRFIKVFELEAKRFSDAKFLVQGTLYPDVIESAGTRGPAAVIKTHHNVGGLPEKLGVELVEPLRDLFKDEVRQVGRELGLPESILMRHPFPGPGLAVRILGEVDTKAVSILQEADAIFIEELRNSGWYDRVSQALAVLLPVRSVGVMGDARTYERVIALRSVDTRDFMTADFSPLPHDLLARVASRITNEVRGVNRVVYDVTSKPPGTVEWE